MSIEDTALEHFSALPKTGINTSTKTCPHYAMFHSFLSDDIKQDAATTTAHNKILIELSKGKNIDFSIKYNMGKYLWLCREIYLCLCTIPNVSYVAMLIGYN